MADVLPIGSNQQKGVGGGGEGKRRERGEANGAGRASLELEVRLSIAGEGKRRYELRGEAAAILSWPRGEVTGEGGGSVFCIDATVSIGLLDFGPSCVHVSNHFGSDRMDGYLLMIGRLLFYWCCGSTTMQRIEINTLRASPTYYL